MFWFWIYDHSTTDPAPPARPRLSPRKLGAVEDCSFELIHFCAFRGHLFLKIYLLQCSNLFFSRVWSGGRRERNEYICLVWKEARPTCHMITYACIGPCAASLKAKRLSGSDLLIRWRCYIRKQIGRAWLRKWYFRSCSITHPDRFWAFI